MRGDGLWRDRAVDAIMRIVEGATVRILLLALLIVAMANLIWLVLGASQKCR